MKDNDIIKALECCRNGLCTDCPRLNTPAHILLCKEQLMCEALDLINRQKAEIERLNNLCFCLSNERDAYKEVLDTSVAEAVKEFAERLKNYYTKKKIYDRPNAHTLIGFLFSLIDDIAEEMVGAESG